MADENNQPTKKCPSCQKDIPAGAKKCPYCQSDLRTWFRRHPILTVLGGLVIFFVVVSIGGSSKEGEQEAATPKTETETPKAQETPTEVNLREFLNEFDNNQLAAEEKWSGKLIEFTGTVSNISGSSSSPYVSFESESDEFLGASVTCRTLKDTSQAVSLENRQRVTVSGVVKGQSLGTVVINDCVFK